MKVTEIRSEMMDFGTLWGIALTFENGRRHAVRISLEDLDSEELPERLLAIGKELRKWARKHDKD